MKNRYLVWFVVAGVFLGLFCGVAFHPSAEESGSVPEPFYYWFAPDDSMGVDEIQYINWSWVEDNVFYALTRDGIDVTDTLSVNFSYVFTYRKYSYEFVSGVKGYFEFTLVFDSQSESSYIGVDNVSFNYSDGGLFYDFSDIADVQQIDLDYSLVDGVFTLVVGKHCNKNVHVVLDPIFGRQIFTVGWKDIHDTMRGHRYMMGSRDGVADSITVYTRLSFGSGASTYHLKMALYDTSANLVGETDAILVTGNTAKWSTAPFSEPKPELSSDIYYMLFVISDNAVAQVAVTLEFRPPYYGRYFDIAYEDAFPDSPAWTTANHVLSIYCTYTEIEDIVVPLHPAILIMPFMVFALLLGTRGYE